MKKMVAAAPLTKEAKKALDDLRRALGPEVGPSLDGAIQGVGGYEPFIKLARKFGAAEVIICSSVMAFAEIAELPLRAGRTKKERALMKAVRDAANAAKAPA